MSRLSGRSPRDRPRTAIVPELRRRARRRSTVASGVAAVAVAAVPSGVLSRTVTAWFVDHGDPAWWLLQSVLFGATFAALQLALPDGFYRPGSLGLPAPTPLPARAADERGSRLPPADG